MFEIQWTNKALKNMKRFPRLIVKQIYDNITLLKEIPYPPSLDVKKLAGQPFSRLRVGNYRVIFQIIKDKLVILIINVEHRKKVYKR